MRQLLLSITLILGCPGADHSKPSSTESASDSGAESDADSDGYTTDDGDCNDSDPEAYPGARERCNGADDDCDGEVDENPRDPTNDVYAYVDADGDGSGDPNQPGFLACPDSSGHSTNHNDCDDEDPAIHPGADELCDTVDQDCDGMPNDGWVRDVDGDGYAGAVGDVCDPETASEGEDADCDEGDPGVHAGAEELCNGVDDDCDFKVDEGLVDEDSTYVDSDGDGYGIRSDELSCDMPNLVSMGGDCDDEDAAVNPGAVEACTDGVDNDCSGLLDCEDTICEAESTCLEADCSDGLDDDDDGYADCEDDDCWGRGCAGARIRVATGGGLQVGQRSEHWNNHDLVAEMSGTCGGTESDETSTWFSVATVEGTVQVATESGAVVASCGWSAQGVAQRDHRRYELECRYEAGPESDCVHEVTSSSSKRPVVRDLVYVEPGCGYDSSTLLPTRLEVENAEGAWIRADGHAWYGGPGSYTSTGFHPWSTSYNWDEQEVEFNAPALEAGPWTLLPFSE